MLTTKKVALTFDDGPNPPYTNQILDILRKENIKATFFVCGKNVKRYPQIAKRAVTEDHQIGNHSYDHSFIRTLTGTNFSQILETQKLIDSFSSQSQKLYRGPFLICPFWIKNKLKKHGYKIFGGIAGNDWKKKITSMIIAEKILAQVKDGSIVILHDGHETIQGADRSKTVEALQKIIKVLKAKNYQFITVDKINYK